MTEVLNPMVAIVPALGDPSEGASRLRTTLNQNGILDMRVPTNMGEMRRDSWEYMLSTSPLERRHTDKEIDGHQGLIAECGALVVVNDLTEHVLDSAGEQICEIPNSVGYYARRVINLANQVYGGPGNGRVFLSGRWPRTTELLAVDSRRKAVTVARQRMQGVYESHPVALNGDFDPLLAIARQPRARRIAGPMPGEGEV
jgi:hypothetical protein